ncbi:hypothetical protein [Bacillus taeanensis]|uniref:Uncharacterized protein n=1 Tax=Bacillus taeanensis TaxID=273032 RepID=A0A366Y045_9BACI|nr:hypothetical protein [Bacillus taeanensis]RBW69774.1 hypothetical protein DS031_09585 [Bacillus taeanensis]
MKLVLTFKDGLTSTQYLDKYFRDASYLLGEIQVGKENNTSITLEDYYGNKLVRTWSEVRSVEIIYDEDK